MERSSKTKAADGPDGGWGWVVVATAFILNVLNGGLFSLHGILYDAFLNTFPDLNPTSTALVISLQVGLCYISGLSVGPVLAVWSCRKITVLGCALMGVGLSVTAFAPSSPYLYAFFSILTGMGTGLACLPPAVLVQRYFTRNRSLAGGISLSGGPVGTFIFPPVCQLLRQEYGWRGMLLLFAGFLLHGLPFALLLRPLQSSDTELDSKADKKQELEPGTCSEKTRKALSQVFNVSILRKPGTWVSIAVYCLAFSGIAGFNTNLIQKCNSLKISRRSAAFMISVSGIMETLSRVLSGAMGNFRCVNRIYLFSCGLLICGLSSILSGFVTNYTLLMVYAGTFGATIGAFVGLGSTVLVDLLGKDILPYVLGFCFLAGGIGSFIALPLTAISLELSGNPGSPFFIIGSCHALASIIMLSFYISRKFKSHKQLPSNEWSEQT